MLILNSRVAKDKTFGETTCKTVSAIDYCIGYTDFISNVSDFVIMPFSTLLSDVYVHNYW